MPSKSKPIPVYTFPAEMGAGIIIARSSIDGSPRFKEVERSHRDGGYSFILQEKGSTLIEIDFREYKITAPALVYMHPSQVHRLIGFEKATFSSWIISSENLLPENLQLLESLAPAGPLSLETETLSILSETASLCIQLSQRKLEKLYHQVLKGACNTLVALTASQLLSRSKPVAHLSRPEMIAKAFKSALELSFRTVKSPAAYAAELHISAPYLNECVKAATGQSVTYHIQQRVVLEAKRELHHSDKSVKEIAAGLGYEDYSYFVRLFSRTAGMTPLAFRGRNLE